MAVSSSNIFSNPPLTAVRRLCAFEYSSPSAGRLTNVAVRTALLIVGFARSITGPAVERWALGRKPSQSGGRLMPLRALGLFFAVALCACRTEGRTDPAAVRQVIDSLNAK